MMAARGEVIASPVFVSRKPNRPQLVPDEVMIRFLTGLRAGNSRADSAIMAGLSPRTVEGWLLRANGHRPDHGPAGPEHLRFRRMVEEAEAAQRVQVVSNLFAMTRKDFQAAKYWLERRHPDWAPDHTDTAATVQQNNNVILIDRTMLDGLVRERLLTGRAVRLGLPAPAPEDVESTPDGTRYRSLDSLRSED